MFSRPVRDQSSRSAYFFFPFASKPANPSYLTQSTCFLSHFPANSIPPVIIYFLLLFQTFSTRLRSRKRDFQTQHCSQKGVNRRTADFNYSANIVNKKRLAHLFHVTSSLERDTDTCASYSYSVLMQLQIQTSLEYLMRVTCMRRTKGVLSLLSLLQLCSSQFYDMCLFTHEIYDFLCRGSPEFMTVKRAAV